MASIFSTISDEFLEDLSAIRSLVDAFNIKGISTRTRIASANSATLLLAATFEEFIREMGRNYAREVVKLTTDPKNVPRKLTLTAWKKTLEGLARTRFDGGNNEISLEKIVDSAQLQFDNLCAFIKGDTSKEIYDGLIHNEVNMRTNEINSTFKISGLDNACSKASCEQPLLDHLLVEPDSASGILNSRLEDFFERRNTIAHSLNQGNSSAPEQIFAEN